MSALATRPAPADGPVRRPGHATRRRSVAVGVGALLVATAAGLAALTLGRLGLALPEVAQVLGGGGTRIQRFVVLSDRLPRVAVGALAGLALGVAGALLQSVTRNPLGSPDVIGLGSGAAAGAAAAGLVWPGAVPVPVGALIGAGIAITAVFLGSGRGFASPFRMVVVGIAVGAMALAFVETALARATREDALEVAAWIYGSLAARGWDDVLLVGAAVVLLLPAALALSRPLGLVEMGDESATALGVPPAHVRTAGVVLAVLLTAAAVAVCGPVAFVALTAPQVARRLTRAAGPGLAAAGCTGAALLVVADQVAQRAVPGTPYPVGVVTGALGGAYLAYLLVREWRRASA
ncbi:FecCD family ABC transporter permease [Cellulomonas marina]|uniref:Iron complex transport system permease protein n=1 Tax=Cellulomonas marina TaxID=988821 RepID=A0A1I0Z3M9_9CELL|nr:iron chelate uptake ABC transporter family permease subunit [Cellulomonas marina]GIG28140.1 iron-enterobactin transporter permease [Cellulomonas marina]SFB18873.1 iron complex transport system permease protein [Cellulomonas marina]